MNDNNDDKGIRLFHLFFMVFSVALITFGMVLAATMIYGSYKNDERPQIYEDIDAIAQDENAQSHTGGPMPQMHPVPDLFEEDAIENKPPGVFDMDSVEDEQKDDLSLPLFDPEAQPGGDEKSLELVPVYPEEELKP